MPSVGELKGNYDPHKIEDEISKFWRENRVYEKIRESLRGKPKFYFLDGPPYPSSGVPHIGTVWNKVMKDLIVRILRMKRFNVRDQPGYDTHGLPIEVAVEKTLGLQSKKEIVEKIGIREFVTKCKSLARTNAGEMSRQFEKVGVSLDWENPYYTFNTRYIELGWWLIKRAYERGLLSKGLRVVHWCPRCETVLADYEVTEYRDLEDPSIYVKLPVKGREKEYILIWTTTPWTLPANTGVMVHPEMVYVKVYYKGETYILARERVRHVFEELLKTSDYKVLEEFAGSKLEGLKYEPPLKEEVKVQRELLQNPNSFKVVLSEEYVTAREGTGCVHTAPGHGQEDFEVGMKYGLPVVSPVDNSGVFTSETGKYSGFTVRDANEVIIRDLKGKGLLLHATTVVHKYPVCWRCKTPLILRATEQWYIRVSQLKDKMLEEAERVDWVPKWALDRFKNWLRNVRDWVISRQRYWGTPIPIWECKNCGERVVIGSLKELEEKCEEFKSVEDLHKPWIDELTFKCENCGGVMERVPDVLDVWFDSGIAFYASLGSLEEWEKLKPVDLILEGHDQIAGWFFSLLRAGVLGFNVAPYKRVLVHGFMLDEKGREMHKSLGNYVEPDEVIERFGRDTLRLWLLQNTVWEDARFNWRAIDQAFRDLTVLWNVYVFASTYMSIDNFNPEKARLEDLVEHLSLEDKWILSKINRLILEVDNAFENLRIHDAVRLLRNFIVEDVSHWYVRLIRRIVWIEEEDPKKLAVYSALYYVLKNFLKLIAPFTPFVAEEIYSKVFKPAEAKLPESVHMLEWPKPELKWLSDSLEEDMEVVKKIVEAGLSARNKAGIKVRQPLPALYVISGEREVSRIVREYSETISSQVNVKKVEYKSLGEVGGFKRYKLQPIYKVLGPKFRGKTGKVLEALEEDADRIAREILEEGEARVKVDGEEHVVTREMVEVVEEPVAGFVVEEFEMGTVALDVKVDEEELAEGLARDLVRRVQFMRKELKLPVTANVEVYVYTLDVKGLEYLEKYRDYISVETRASKFTVSSEAPEGDYDLYREWDISGEKYVVYVKKV